MRVTLSHFIPKAAEEFHVRVDNILSHTRLMEYARPRQALYWLGREKFDLTFEQIGRVMGRDHTTVMSGYHKALQLREDDSRFRDITDRLAGAAPSPLCPCCKRPWPAYEYERAAA